MLLGGFLLVLILTPPPECAREACSQAKSNIIPLIFQDITMDSGKQECVLGMLYEVARLNGKAPPQGITSVVFLDSQLWITLNLMVFYLIVVRTVVELFHATERLPHRLLTPSHNLQDHQVIQRMRVKMDQ